MSERQRDVERPTAPKPRRWKPTGSRAPAGSTTYSQILPALIVGLAIVLGLLVLVAVGVLLGLVPYR